jgi:hypothetical protein
MLYWGREILAISILMASLITVLAVTSFLTRGLLKRVFSQLCRVEDLVESIQNSNVAIDLKSLEQKIEYLRACVRTCEEYVKSYHHLMSDQSRNFHNLDSKIDAMYRFEKERLPG